MKDRRLEHKGYRSGFSLICCLVTLALAAALGGCAENGGEAEEEEDRSPPEHFAFAGEGDGGGDECGGECETSEIGMCWFVRNAHALAVVDIESRTESDADCEDLEYRNSHETLEVEVLDVAAGTEDFSGSEDVIALEELVEEDATQAIVSVRKLDGEWFLNYGTGIEESEDEVEADDKEYTDGDLVYDLPTSWDEFEDEAEAHWNDFAGECDQYENDERMWIDEDDFADSIYDTPDCDGSVNNSGDDGPVDDDGGDEGDDGG